MFTPFESSIGAWLLHFGTSAFLFSNGRVLGCSSTLYSSVFDPNPFSTPVIGGMLSTGIIVKYLAPKYSPDYSSVAALAPFGHWTPIIAGCLTGFGTKLGSGCTSGHMLIGLARGSLRSLVATVTFSSVAMFTARLLNTIPSCPDGACHQIAYPPREIIIPLFGLLGVSYFVTNILKTKMKVNKASQSIVSFVSGAIFSLGLIVSGLASPAKTLGFLALLPPKFDPSLLMVVAFGIVPNMIEIFTKGYKLAPSPAVDQFSLPTSTKVTAKLILGSAIFGIGWGISGICPGPGVVSLIFNGTDGLKWVGGFLASYHLASIIT